MGGSARVSNHGVVRAGRAALEASSTTRCGGATMNTLSKDNGDLRPQTQEGTTGESPTY